jgi:hypothetical protein
MGKVLRLRTRLLLCGAALAPGSILLFHMYREALIREAQAEGAITAWVDPGPPVYWMFYLGVICFLGFLISLMLDLRRLR